MPFRLRCSRCGKFFSSIQRLQKYCSRECDYKSRPWKKSPRSLFEARKESLRSRAHYWDNVIEATQIYSRSNHKDRGELLDTILSMVVERDGSRSKMKDVRESATKRQMKSAVSDLRRAVHQISRVNISRE